jgi:hypothetical protein
MCWQKHVLIPEVVDAAIDRFRCTFARATADFLGCPRPHYAHRAHPAFVTAYGSSPEWVLTHRIRELVPSSGRLCADHIHQVVQVVGNTWDGHLERWLALALLTTHVDLEYATRLLPAHSDASPFGRAGEATTRVCLPEAFHPDHLATLTRQVYAWRDEPGRSLSSGRREPLQIGLLVLQIKELVLCTLKLPPPRAAVLHAWLTAGHLAGSADLRASLVVRYLFYAGVVVDHTSVPYCPRWKQGSAQFFRLLRAIVHTNQLELVPRLLTRMQSLFGPALMARFRQRLHGSAAHGLNADETLRPYVYVFTLTFGEGDLSFENTEGIACELKDALLHKRGVRSRHHRSEMQPSLALDHFPLDVAEGTLRSFVRVDMSPASMVVLWVDDDERVKANFDRARQTAAAERARLVVIARTQC